ncbi:MAG: DNA replication/repair protein RecF [Corynebacterium sp.]|nr:DNA replication/repair protein RecF [Corynebacterium sp.]
MYLRSVDLVDFRSWPQLHVDMQPGVTAFIGPNGQGKTNIVEAICYMATLSSHRVSSDAPLIRESRESARISTHAINNNRELTTHLLINQGKANQAQINRTRCKSPRELLGIVKTVLFAPEDLALVRGEPAQRRRYLDEIIAYRRPRFLGVKAEYEKILRQRNATLKSRRNLETLDIWDAQLAHTGAVIMAFRRHLVEELSPFISQAYAELAPQSRPATLRYAPSVEIPYQEDLDDTYLREIEQTLLEALAAARPREVERGQSLVGPHRDDCELLLGSQPAKGFASHGETWSFALALKIATFYLLRQDGTDPILILDDVFAELDAARRRALTDIIKTAEQVIITAAVDEDLPAAFVENAAIHEVRAVDDPDGPEHARISILDPEASS